MAEVTNLRMARKARLRAAKADEAAANRSKFGQTKAEKSTLKRDAARAAQRLDGAKREHD